MNILRTYHSIRATEANISNVRPFVNAIDAMGQPLYQCQPPTGFGDRERDWNSAGALIARLNFAQALAGNGLNAATLDESRTVGGLRRLAEDVLADDLSWATREEIEATRLPLMRRVGLLLGSPEFQRR